MKICWIQPLTTNKEKQEAIRTQEDVFGVLYGAYNRVSATAYYGRDYIIFGEVRSDNAMANGNSGRFLTPATMDMGNSDAYARDSWDIMYKVIANANIIIEQDAASLDGDLEEIRHMQGQAYALRAMAHFDLMRLYGQLHISGQGGMNSLAVPYMLKYRDGNLLPSRNTTAEVRAFIYDDLEMALDFMSEDKNGGCTEFSTYTVQAIRSRVGTYFGDWDVVIEASEAIIESGEFAVIDADNFAKSFSKDAKCAINKLFEIAASDTDNNGINGLHYIYNEGNYGDVNALDNVANLFEAGDVRGSDEMLAVDGDDYLRNIGKYPEEDYTNNIALFRYEEVVLNYAEALLATDPATSLIYLNMIPAKRGATAYTEATLDNILLERRKEFVFEGLRFYDLARTGRDIPAYGEGESHGGPEYGSSNYAFPIPISEINANKNMTQNYGY